MAFVASAPLQLKASCIQRLSSHKAAGTSRCSVLPHKSSQRPGVAAVHRRTSVRVHAQSTDEEVKPKLDLDSTTEKYGLEAGLWEVFTSKGEDGKLSKGDQAKQLLARYGSAYLITSISFAIVSFAICYALVNSGVDVAALLAKIGLTVNDTNEKVGTFAIAYAAHKALSPVRFPPTVALTPVVAKALGKDRSAPKPEEDQESQN